MPRRSQKSIANACDKLWAKIILAKGYCEKCGKTADERQLHPHHVYGRRDHRLRWDIRNGCCLCAYHHRWWAHEHPLEFAAWFNWERPRDAVHLMHEHQKGPIKRTLADYKRLEAELREALEGIPA